MKLRIEGCFLETIIHLQRVIRLDNGKIKTECQSTLVIWFGLN